METSQERTLRLVQASVAQACAAQTDACAQG